MVETKEVECQAAGMRMVLEIPDEMALLLEETGIATDRGLVLEAAASLVARGCLSSGKAARLLGMSRLDFLDEMARRRISTVGAEHWTQEA